LNCIRWDPQGFGPNYPQNPITCATTIWLWAGCLDTSPEAPAVRDSSLQMVLLRMSIL